MSYPSSAPVFEATDPSGRDEPDASPAPALSGDELRRVRMTLSCADADPIPKVAGAGDVFVEDGVRLQRMHNGLTVEAGAYCGEMMVEIIKGLHGHHEPQEEVVTDFVVRRLAAEVAGGAQPPVIVEFGAFWAYFSMWFVRDIPGARAVALEPDPFNLGSGERNAARNGLSDRIDFVPGVVGAEPGTVLDFVAESDGRTYPLPAYDLASLLVATGHDRADVLLLDIQGYELGLLERAREQLRSGVVRFVLLSTHHHTISDDPLIHQKCLALLRECGAHIIAEHTISESYSGDGLIAASFSPRDADVMLTISHARAQDSLFGGLEKDVAHFQHSTRAAQEATDHASRHIERIEHERAEAIEERDDARAERDALRHRLEAITSSRPWRAFTSVRGGVDRLTRRRSAAN